MFYSKLFSSLNSSKVDSGINLFFDIPTNKDGPFYTDFTFSLPLHYTFTFQLLVNFPCIFNIFVVTFNMMIGMLYLFFANIACFHLTHVNNFTLVKFRLVSARNPSSYYVILQPWTKNWQFLESFSFLQKVERFGLRHNKSTNQVYLNSFCNQVILNLPYKANFYDLMHRMIL